VGGITVDAKNVYFTLQTGNIVQPTSTVDSCPVSGCVLAPTQIAGNLVYVGPIAVTQQSLALITSRPTTGNAAQGLLLIALDDSAEVELVPTRSQHTAYLSTFVTSGTYVYYRYLSSGGTYPTYRCTATNGACAANIQMQTNSDFTGSTTTPFTADGAKLFFVKNGALVSCDANTGCASTTTVMSAFNGSPLRAFSGTLYFGQSAYGVISSCAESGCATPTTITDFNYRGGELAVDGAGIYWAAGSTIRGCHLPSCAGGPIDLARNQTGPASLIADGKFVYWTTGFEVKADGGKTPDTATITRVRHW
jgi:hypothetical protein